MAVGAAVTKPANLSCVSALLEGTGNLNASHVSTALASCNVLLSGDDSHGEHHPHIIIPLGLFILFASMLALLFHKIKQPPIIASIVIGIIGALPMFKPLIEPDLPLQLVDAFVEVGFILVLFMGGLEVDLGSLGSNIGKIGIFGAGQIISTFGFYMMMGHFVVPVFNGDGVAAMTSSLFFGICMTLSSTILVIGTLNKRHALSENYGQIVLGIMVLQDVLAVTSLAILDSLDPTKDVDVAIAIVLIFAKLIGLLFILFILSKFVLERAFGWFAVSEELTFLGTFGYCFGVAGLCGIAGFSAEMGAFFAGVSVSALPYKIEIENKAEPLKYFGIALFFIMLGFELTFTLEDFAMICPWAILLSFLTVVISPILMLLLGRAAGTLVRPNYYTGMIINQISEFSLVIAKLATSYKVFSSNTFLLVAITCVISLFFSALSHEFIENIWLTLEKCVDKVDETRSSIVEQAHSLKFGHVVICEYTEIAQGMLDYYTETVGEEDIEITIITLNPKVQKHFAHMQEDAEAMAEQTQNIQGRTYRTRETILKKRTKTVFDEVVVNMPVGNGGSRSMGNKVVPLEILQTAEKAATPDRNETDVSELTDITEAKTDRRSSSPTNKKLVDLPRPRREGVVKVTCVYADMMNPIVWHHLHFDKAMLVVSCHPDCYRTNLALCRFLMNKVPFIPSTTTSKEAIHLYKEGADYVIQIDLLAADAVRTMILPKIEEESEFKIEKARHLQELQSLSSRLQKAFEYA